MSDVLKRKAYRSHECGDSVLISVPAPVRLDARDGSARTAAGWIAELRWKVFVRIGCRPPLRKGVLWRRVPWCSEQLPASSGMAAAEIRRRPLSRIGCVTPGVPWASERMRWESDDRFAPNDLVYELRLSREGSRRGRTPI